MHPENENPRMIGRGFTVFAAEETRFEKSSADIWLFSGNNKMCGDAHSFP
jgi:hypothetical protein